MAFEDVRRAVFEDVPEDLELPIRSIDHSDHVVMIGMRGYPQLAVDYLLNRENIGKISKIIPSIIRQLNLEFLKNE